MYTSKNSKEIDNDEIYQTSPAPVSLLNSKINEIYALVYTLQSQTESLGDKLEGVMEYPEPVAEKDWGAERAQPPRPAVISNLESLHNLLGYEVAKINDILNRLVV